MKKTLVFYGGKKQDINKVLEGIVTNYRSIYDICICSCQRICMQCETFNPDEMYCVQRAEFLAYLDILRVYNPDMDTSTLIDTLIKFE